MVATIQYIESVIATYRAATEANRNTETRQGNAIVLDGDSADDVMITADLHGHRRNFNLIKKRAALETHPRRHLVMQEVCHGGPTYPGGGCMSHSLLEDVRSLELHRDELCETITPLGLFTALDIPDRFGPTWSRRNGV